MIQRVTKGNIFFVPVVRVELLLIILHLSCYPGFSFVSRPEVSLELGQSVRAVINTVHIQLEHFINWTVFEFIVILLTAK